ncbi:glycosyltransferase family 2 protein [Deminuibacter soli]|uniref:Glycosyltransferase n=1 Tax=Deminuibacter soli TaxID=2291815 RepID=A0A3E1NMF3_9BACT|nr:glycosyltransferase family 2 protein [Deminuibacter soli]RFM29092.1 glycosyltransferase [Deminuibacter soli]
MKQFTPYAIVHVQLTEGFTVAVPPGNTYLVLWWQGVPLGHIWYCAATMPGSAAQLRRDILQAIAPAVWHYAAGVTGTAVVTAENSSDAAIQHCLQQVFDTLNNRLQQAPAESLSVVICTRNRPGPLQQCITELMKSHDRDFELIVVDNASDTAATRLVVQQFDGVKYVFEPRKGLDIARNTGAASATRAIIAYTDDDVLVSREWTAQLKKAFANRTTMAVTGLVLPYALDTEAQYIFEKYWGFNKGFAPVTFDHAFFMAKLDDGVPAWDVGAGASMAFRREAFDLFGWFDERLDVGAAGCSGDSEYWYRILAEGFNCVYLPHIYVLHQHRADKASLHRQLFSYMRGLVSSLYVQHERYGHRGNLTRIHPGLSNYYLNRLKQRLRYGATPDFTTFFTEVKGCISGRRFYRSNRQTSSGSSGMHNPTPLAPAVVNEHTWVTVVITCYNQGQFLEESIRSVYRQTFQRFELVVVDDGSSDNTAAIAQQFREVKYVRTERVGLSAARNIGAAHGNAPFILFLDADDFLYPNALEVNLYYFSIVPDAAFVSGGHDRVDEHGSVMQHVQQEAESGYCSLLQGNYIGMEATVLYRKELFFRYHFNTALSVCEDYDLNLHIARNYPIFSHTTRIAAYRFHSFNVSRDKQRMLKAALATLEKQYPYLTSAKQKEAYQQGLVNWNRFYLTEAVQY